MTSSENRALCERLASSTAQMPSAVFSPSPIALPDPGILAYRVNDAARAAGVCRATIYNLIKAKKLRSVMVLGRRLIPAEALRELFQTAA
jgi:excisionase family DNA binding protein